MSVNEVNMRYRFAWMSARRRARIAAQAFYAEASAARELEAAAVTSEFVPKEKVRALLAKWEADRTGYPPSVIGVYVDIAVKLCGDELAELIGDLP